MTFRVYYHFPLGTNTVDVWSEAMTRLISLDQMYWIGPKSTVQGPPSAERDVSTIFKDESRPMHRLLKHCNATPPPNQSNDARTESCTLLKKNEEVHRQIL
jgi:hypothetical protein